MSGSFHTILPDKLTVLKLQVTTRGRGSFNYVPTKDIPADAVIGAELPLITGDEETTCEGHADGAPGIIEVVGG